MTRAETSGVQLNFYIDKTHFPYQLEGDHDFNNTALAEALGGCNTWLLWTLRTYLELRGTYECRLTDTMPESGIVFFFRGSVNLVEKPNKNQFWVCMTADTTWHPYSQVNLFQNTYWINKYPQAYFVRHWPQLNIIKSKPIVSELKNIAYFGDLNNLAAELKSEDWNDFINDNGYVFMIPPSKEWNNYSDIDLVIGIRSFDKNERFLSKPSSKLINAWRAGTVYISGNDSACLYEKQGEYDFIQVDSYEALKGMLLLLRQDEKLFGKYKSQAVTCGERFSNSFFASQWMELIDKQIVPRYKKAAPRNILTQGAFISRRFFIYKWAALMGRVSKLVNLL